MRCKHYTNKELSNDQLESKNCLPNTAIMATLGLVPADAPPGQPPTEMTMRYQFTREQQKRGGRTTASLPGGVCLRCGKQFSTHPKFAGHLGLHSFADKYTHGDMRQAAHKLNLIGIAATDPFPANGAFANAHRVADDIRRQQRQE